MVRHGWKINISTWLVTWYRIYCFTIYRSPLLRNIERLLPECWPGTEFIKEADYIIRYQCFRICGIHYSPLLSLKYTTLNYLTNATHVVCYLSIYCIYANFPILRKYKAHFRNLLKLFNIYLCHENITLLLVWLVMCFLWGHSCN